VSLGKTINAISHLGAIVVAQPDERDANRTAVCWSGMTDTEHTNLVQL